MGFQWVSSATLSRASRALVSPFASLASGSTTRGADLRRRWKHSRSMQRRRQTPRSLSPMATRPPWPGQLWLPAGQGCLCAPWTLNTPFLFSRLPEGRLVSDCLVFDFSLVFVLFCCLFFPSSAGRFRYPHTLSLSEESRTRFFFTAVSPCPKVL